jgi:glutathione S-transferase
MYRCLRGRQATGGSYRGQFPLRAALWPVLRAQLWNNIRVEAKGTYSRMKPVLFIGNKNYSSWSLRAWFLLKEAGIDFDEVRIPLDTPEFSERIANISPARKVPVLQLGDHPIWESLAIAETVAERWPERKLWPEDRHLRANARSLCAEMHAGFMALREAMPMNCRAMGRKVTLTDAVTGDINRIFAIWAECRRRYGGGEGWLFDKFSIADTMYAPVVFRFRTYGVDLPESAAGYPARVMKSKAIQEWLAASESETEVVDADEKGQ